MMFQNNFATITAVSGKNDVLELPKVNMFLIVHIKVGRPVAQASPPPPLPRLFLAPHARIFQKKPSENLSNEKLLIVINTLKQNCIGSTNYKFNEADCTYR